MPMAPAPTMTSFFGCSVSVMASRELMIVLPSNSAPGSGRALAPVAMRMCFAVSVRCTLPWASRTSAFPLAGMKAEPSTCSILFFLNRAWMPLFRLPATVRLRPMTLEKSWETLPVFTPQSPASWAAQWYSSAACSSALVGIQPQLRQTPPSLSRSTHATRMPSCAARIAPTYPAGPPPITTRS